MGFATVLYCHEVISRKSICPVEMKRTAGTTNQANKNAFVFTSLLLLLDLLTRDISAFEMTCISILRRLCPSIQSIISNFYVVLPVHNAMALMSWVHSTFWNSFIHAMRRKILYTAISSTRLSPNQSFFSKEALEHGKQARKTPNQTKQK